MDFIKSFFSQDFFLKEACNKTGKQASLQFFLICLVLMATFAVSAIGACFSIKNGNWTFPEMRIAKGELANISSLAKSEELLALKEFICIKENEDDCTEQAVGTNHITLGKDFLTVDKRYEKRTIQLKALNDVFGDPFTINKETLTKAAVFVFTLSIPFYSIIVAISLLVFLAITSLVNFVINKNGSSYGQIYKLSCYTAAPIVIAYDLLLLLSRHFFHFPAAVAFLLLVVEWLSMVILTNFVISKRAQSQIQS